MGWIYSEQLTKLDGDDASDNDEGSKMMKGRNNNDGDADRNYLLCDFSRQRAVPNTFNKVINLVLTIISTFRDYYHYLQYNLLCIECLCPSKIHMLKL